jgi:hypothetical protein
MISEAAARKMGIPLPKKGFKKTTASARDPGNIFFHACQAIGLYPHAEYRFHPDRKWRFDWAFPLNKIAIEVQGGIFSQGRHVRGAAMLKEFEKLNTAAEMGWRILFVTPQQFERGDCLAMVQRALKS